MKIYDYISLSDFNAWGGAKDTLETLTITQINTIENILSEMTDNYQPLTATRLNDILWFERDKIAEWLGFKNWEKLEEHNESARD